MDGAGNLYGSTISGGGDGGWGTVFKLTPDGSLTTLHLFTGDADGQSPDSCLIIDSAENLYGTTRSANGGIGAALFKLERSGSNYTKTTLYSFPATGDRDASAPIMDSAGNFYLTTRNQFGKVIKLTPSAGSYIKTVLYAFNSEVDGDVPLVAPVMDSNGNLYGTTYRGGASWYGTVFKLSRTDIGYTKTTLYSFLGGADGKNPTGPLILDNAGNLYGTTEGGGSSGGSQGAGTVFKIGN